MFLLFYNISMELFSRTDVISTRFRLFFGISVLNAVLRQDQWKALLCFMSLMEVEAQHRQWEREQNIWWHWKTCSSTFFLHSFFKDLFIFSCLLLMFRYFFLHPCERKKNSMCAWITLLAQNFLFKVADLCNFIWQLFYNVSNKGLKTIFWNRDALPDGAKRRTAFAILPQWCKFAFKMTRYNRYAANVGPRGPLFVWNSLTFALFARRETHSCWLLYKVG